MIQRGLPHPSFSVFLVLYTTAESVVVEEDGSLIFPYVHVTVTANVVSGSNLHFSWQM